MSRTVRQWVCVVGLFVDLTMAFVTNRPPFDPAAPVLFLSCACCFFLSLVLDHTAAARVKP